LQSVENSDDQWNRACLLPAGTRMPGSWTYCRSLLIDVSRASGQTRIGHCPIHSCGRTEGLRPVGPVLSGDSGSEGGHLVGQAPDLGANFPVRCPNLGQLGTPLLQLLP